MPKPTIDIVVEERAPFADGMSFRDAGPYERVKGRAYFGLDPDDERNRGIVDLTRAPRNPAGLVAYTATLFILKPLDIGRGNGRLLYDVNNRGNKRALQFFNDATTTNEPRSGADAGNGFLMRRGYTVVWSGWQGDLLPVEGRMTMEVPAATERGREITGTVRAEFIVEEPSVKSVPLSGNHYIRPYETTSLDTGSAVLTCRRRERDRREPVAPTAWQFARFESGVLQPSHTDCYLADGFRPGWIYELVYRARNPSVLGLGFAAVRDLADFLRHEEQDSAGRTNPLWDAGAHLERAYAWGRSQSGRFLREFIYRGFNVGRNNRRIFDGVAPHVTGAGRLALNYRFAQPDRYPRQHEDHLYPSDEFPFSYGFNTDPCTGRIDTILKRTDTDPRIIHTQTATEYWQRRGSLVHTGASGKDLPEHPDSRIYLLAGMQHNDASAAPEGGRPRFALNPIPANPVLRALLDALDRWATHGTPPPRSRYPNRSDASLVAFDTFEHQFPRLPGLSCPAGPNRLFRLDYGPDFDRGLLGTEPPMEDAACEYAVLVPGVDADGNESSGIVSPEVAVPLATYTGWNLSANTRILAGIAGGMIPFPATAAMRAQEDPRPSIEERYRSKSEYLDLVRAAALRLVDDGVYLDEDVSRCVQRAAKTWDWLVASG